MSRCIKCQAEITWAIRMSTLAKIPLVPLNPLFPDAPRFTISGTRANGDKECGRDNAGAWISHFSECKHAAHFSKRRNR